MQTYTYEELTPRAKLAAYTAYIKDAWTIQGKPPRMIAPALFKGWRFNAHGERIAD